MTKTKKMSDSDFYAQVAARLEAAPETKPGPSASSAPPAHMTMTPLPSAASRRSLADLVADSTPAEPVAVSSAPPAERPAESSELPAATLHAQWNLPVVEAYGRTFLMIPIDRLEANKWPPRSVYSEEVLKSRALSLQQIGQQSPIHVIPHPDAPGRFIVGDGWTRVQACLHYGVRDALLAQVHLDKSEQEVAWMGYATNDEQHQCTEFDRALFYQALVLEGVSHEEIAQRSGRSRSTVTRCLAFARLTDEVKDIVRQAPQQFGLHHANLLLQCITAGHLRPAARLAQQVLDEQRPLWWLRLEVDRLLKPKAKPDPIKLRTRVRKTFANGRYEDNGKRFVLDLSVPLAKAAELREELNRVLASFAEEIPPPEGRAGVE